MVNLIADPTLQSTWRYASRASTPPDLDERASKPLQEDVDGLLRKKRKLREHKACYPCRRRKVKCDLTQPCQTCRDRDHPDLCSYQPSEKRGKGDDGSIHQTEENLSTSLASTTTTTISKIDFEVLCHKLDGLQDSIAKMRTELNGNKRENLFGSHRSGSGDGRTSPTELRLDDVSIRLASASTTTTTTTRKSPLPRHHDVHGLHTLNDAGEYVHFGGGSIPALLFSISQGLDQSKQLFQTQETDSSAYQCSLQEALGKTVVPLFGLGNESATFPFVDLWGLPHASQQRAELLAKALPDDEQLLKLWICYRDLGHVVYPGIANLIEFETNLQAFLLNRAAQPRIEVGVTERSVYGQEICWLGLLFAVLGSGAQCSTIARKERELTSQVYTCCAFECLRFTNFLSRPRIISIETLCVIGDVLTNNMNAGTAWTLLGTTIRLAQGLGLHRSCPPHARTSTKFIRSKVWWAVVWQDSLLSITYDRASSVLSPGVQSMAMPHSLGDLSPYHRSMYRLCRAGLEIISDRAQAVEMKECLPRITQHRSTIHGIINESADYLQDVQKCTSPTEMLQNRSLHLHTSYLLSELYRPAISDSTSDCETVYEFRQACVDSLANTIKAYLQLHAVTSYSRTSWAAIHRSLSSALLLGILGEHTRNDRAHQLIIQFISAMTDSSGSLDPQEISAPIQRGIAALRKLNIEKHPNRGSIGGAMQFLDTSSRYAADRLGVDADDPAFISMPDSNTSKYSDHDHSPHAILQHILWGPNPAEMSTDVPNSIY